MHQDIVLYIEHDERPTLITIIGVLEIVLGVLVLIGAIGLFVLGSMDYKNMGLDAQAIADIDKILSDANMSWSTVMYSCGVIFLIPAIIDIVVGYGFLQGWTIFWWIGIILNGLSAIGGVILLIVAIMGVPVGAVAAIIGLIINGVIIWYLLQPNVKEFFKVN